MEILVDQSYWDYASRWIPDLRVNVDNFYESNDDPAQGDDDILIASNGL